MPDGVVFHQEEPVGVYSVFIDGTIRISLDSGQDPHELLKHLGENGQTLNLLAMPLQVTKE